MKTLWTVHCSTSVIYEVEADTDEEAYDIAIDLFYHDVAADYLDIDVEFEQIKHDIKEGSAEA